MYHTSSQVGGSGDWLTLNLASEETARLSGDVVYTTVDLHVDSCMHVMTPSGEKRKVLDL